LRNGFLNIGEPKTTKMELKNVFNRFFQRPFYKRNPRECFPFINRNSRIFINPRPDYHTDLFPDSILNNESPQDYIEK
jgi:hypothetical protein